MGYFAACGKSTFVFDLLRNRHELIDEPPVEIVYALPPNQEIIFPEDIQADASILLFKGIPDFEEFKDKRRRLLIIDDQIQDCGNDVVALFTRGSHHFNISVIVLTQNIFFANPGFRTMSLNAHYIVLFKNPRAMDQITVLARQVTPNNVKFFQESFADATKAAHSYFMLDMTQSCSEKLRFRTNIFPNNAGCTTVYMPLDQKKK